MGMKRDMICDVCDRVDCYNNVFGGKMERRVLRNVYVWFGPALLLDWRVGLQDEMCYWRKVASSLPRRYHVTVAVKYTEG
jgi:hypothetical protein